MMNKLRISILMTITLLLLACSSGDVGGGYGSETNSGRVAVEIAQIDTGINRTQAVAVLIPRNFSPVTENSELLRRDTVEIPGIALFDSVPSDTYRIYSYDTSVSLNAITTPVTTTENSSDTLQTGLNLPARVRVHLSKTIDTAGLWVYLRGSLVHKALEQSVVIDTNTNEITLDSVPAGDGFVVEIIEKTSPTNKYVLTDTFSITAGIDTIIAGIIANYEDACATFAVWDNITVYNTGDTTEANNILYECISTSINCSDLTYQPGNQAPTVWQPIAACGYSQFNTGNTCSSDTLIPISGGVVDITEAGSYVLKGVFTNSGIQIAHGDCWINGIQVYHGATYNTLPNPIDGGYYIEFVKTAGDGAIILPPYVE